MHRVPARTCFKFNYDFIGTNQYPIENLNEQLFLMVALAKKDTNAPFNLSPNLFRLYEQACELKFENEADFKLNYLADPESINKGNNFTMNRFITTECKEKFFQHLQKNQKDLCKQVLKSPFEFDRLPFEFDLDVSLERLTVALNDDYLSDVRIFFGAKNFKAQVYLVHPPFIDMC